MTDEQYREKARRFGNEVDDDAIVSRGSDAGAYVQAWVWVPSPDGKPSEDDDEQ